MSDEHRRKIADGVRTAHARPEVKAKISAALKKSWAARGCVPAEHRAFYTKLRDNGYSREEAIGLIQSEQSAA